MKPIFCGNFEYDARESEVERLFSRYGKVDRVNMKSGFAFVYMVDERDAEDAIRGLDKSDFGRRRLRVEWTKQELVSRRNDSGASRRSATNTRPTKTLFVINFDPVNTRPSDLEKHFGPYGKILNTRIRRNFAFLQFESLEDATRALEETNMSKLMDHVISVEYALRDDGERNGHSRDRSPDRRGRDRGRSVSPYGRSVGRASPDYGRGPSPYRKSEQRVSPNYGRAESVGRVGPDYRRDPSPYRKPEQRGSPNVGRAESPGFDKYRSRSPQRQDRS